MHRNGTTPFPDPLERFANSAAVLRRYGGAEAELLSAFEQQHGVRLSEAHRRFLLRVNGLDYDLAIDDDTNLAPERRADAFVLSDINTLFGISNEHPYFDLAVLASNMSFHDQQLTPFANVIGLGGDHCTLVEITDGSHAGKIYYTDGELFPGLSPEQVRPSTDETVSHFLEMGYYMPIASDLDDLFVKLARLV